MSERTKPLGKVQPQRDRQKELVELISEAAKQPGIQQLMEVYQQWKPYEAVARAHQQLLGIHRVVIVSNSSGGSVFGT
ncbi:MAG: hypothetical protein FJ302_14255 [Planctomycetes bacterium]|nr:hypothetical protein [Planctomycetota bacterium]MBM4005623.1 hypothetical protein [Planctomycetota bacterium]